MKVTSVFDYPKGRVIVVEGKVTTDPRLLIRSRDGAQWVVRGVDRGHGWPTRDRLPVAFLLQHDADVRVGDVLSPGS